MCLVEDQVIWSSGNLGRLLLLHTEATAPEKGAKPAPLSLLIAEERVSTTLQHHVCKRMVACSKRNSTALTIMFG